MAATIIPMIKLNVVAFNSWVEKVLEFNGSLATRELSNNEIVFLKNRFREGKRFDEVVI